MDRGSKRPRSQASKAAAVPIQAGFPASVPPRTVSVMGKTFDPAKPDAYLANLKISGAA